jgi:hypothetical protein
MDNKNWKKLLNFQIISKFRTNLNLKQIYDFGDFHSHNKLQEHFTTQEKICIDIKYNKFNYLFI